MADQIPIQPGHTVRVVTRFNSLMPNEKLMVVAVNHAAAGDSCLNVKKKDGNYVIIPEKNVVLIPPVEIILATHAEDTVKKQGIG
jgi:hypothetical protein